MVMNFSHLHIQRSLHASQQGVRYVVKIVLPMVPEDIKNPVVKWSQGCVAVSRVDFQHELKNLI